MSSDNEPPGFVPTFEPDVFHGTGGHALRQAMIDNGFGDTVRSVEALQDINAAELARIALTVYGTSENVTRNELPNSWNLSSDDLNPAQNALTGVADELDRNFNSTISAHWTGNAADAYGEYEKRLRTETETEGDDRISSIGDELLNMARAIQQTQHDQKVTILGGSSVLVSVGGAATATGAGAIALATAGPLIALGDSLRQEVERTATRAEAAAVFARSLERPGMVRLEAADLDLPDIEDADGWEVH